MATIEANSKINHYHSALSDSSAATHTLWNSVQQQTQSIQYSYANTQLVAVNASQQAAVEESTQSNQQGQIETVTSLCTLYSGKAIHANAIDVLRTSANNTGLEQTVTAQRYIAGKSPASIQLSADFLIKGIESGQGVFQFVSRAAHYGGQSRETPLINQLIAALDEQQSQGKALTLGDTYIVVSLNENKSFRELTDGSDRSYCKSFLLTVKDRLGQEHTVPLTQVGLKFTNALLRAEDIAHANRALNRHKKQLVDNNTLAASHQTPMVLSYAGVGRNASLITYHEMTQWISSNRNCTDAEIDEHLKYLVNKGRMARGPRFVHSEQQFAELRRAIIEFRRANQDGDHWAIRVGHEHTHTDNFNSLRAIDQAPLTFSNKLVRSIDYQHQPLGPIKWDLQHKQKDIFFWQNAQSTNPANRIEERAPQTLPLAQQQSKSNKPHPYLAKKPHVQLSALTIDHPTNTNTEALAIESMMIQLLSQSAPNKDALTQELQTTLLRKSLEVACGNNTQQILSTLVTLQGIRPLDEITQAQEVSEQNTFAAPTHPHNLAWKVLVELGTVPRGMDVIRKITKAALSAQQEDHFEILMKAVRHLNTRGVNTITPAHILRSTMGLDEVADHAIPALFSKLTHGANQAHPNDWAINAIKNELFTTAPGSDFSIIANRLYKFGEWVKRAEQDKRFSIRFPFKNKSPFRGLHFGVQGVDRSDINAYKKTWKTAIDNATELLIAQIDSHIVHLNKLISAEESTSDELGNNTPLLHAHRLRKQTSDCYQLQNEIKHQPSIKLLKRAKTDFLSLCAQSNADDDRKISRVRKWAIERKVLNTRTFTDGTAEAKFNHLLETASHAQFGKSTALQRISKESLEESLHHVIDHMQGASRLKLYNGGIGGVGTKGITGSVTSLAGAFLVRGRLDLRASKMRQAVFELAMPPYNLEMIIGSQSTLGYQVGAGVAVGPDAGLVALTAGVDAVAYSRDVADTNGICVRLPRNRGKEQQLRADYKELVSDLIRLTSEKTAPEKILKTVLAKYPELTVNVIDQFNDARTKHSVTTEVTATAGQVIAKGVLSVGATAEYQSSIDRHYSDKTGHMKVQRTLGGKLLKGILSARASLRPIISSGEVIVGVGTTDVYNVSREYATAGQTIRRELVASNGIYNPVSFIEIEHQTLEHFKQSIVDNISEWVRAKAIQFDKKQADAHADIMQFLDQASSHHTITQTFAERC